MAEVKRNMIISGLSGSLGPDHYARITKDGRTIISLKPDFSNRQFSQAQLDTQSRMKQAAAYGKVACKENPLYAQLAEGTTMNAYNLAVKDWRKPPVIHGIKWLDGRLRIDAKDNVLVAGVTVSILDEQGQVLEQGEAGLEYGAWWEYRPGSTGKIRVEARDMAGNVARQDFSPPPA